MVQKLWLEGVWLILAGLEILHKNSGESDSLHKNSRGGIDFQIQAIYTNAHFGKSEIFFKKWGCLRFTQKFWGVQILGGPKRGINQTPSLSYWTVPNKICRV